jgi:hypothetical protein
MPTRRNDRHDAPAELAPVPPKPQPTKRVGLRVSEQCLIRFNGVSGIKESVERTEHGQPRRERLGEVAEPLS